MFKNVTIRATLLALCSTLSITAYAFADAPKHVDIPAGELWKALLQLSKQYGADLVYRPEQIHGFKTQGAHGELTTEQAATRLLAGTPLELHTDSSGAMLITLPRADTLSQWRVEEDPSSQSGQGQKGDSKSDPSEQFHMAQADQGQPSGTSTVEKERDEASKTKPVRVDEVVITGSRIPRATADGPQEVQIYAKDQIEQSGQTTLADFFNTLPSVSQSFGETGFQPSAFGATTVILHGLPSGTTLVLINGRRVETSGADNFADFFDLNNIPLAAVERIEVVPNGSSAIYGSDAIAGVVNIILRKEVDGVEVNAKYGSASGIAESDISLALGRRWSKGSISIIGTFQARGELRGDERGVTADNDYSALGGPNANGDVCSPGNIFSIDGSNLPGLSAPFAAVPKGFRGSPTIQEFQGTAGTLNQCPIFDSSLIPTTHRAGVVVQGNYQAAPSVELFTEIMFSHVLQPSYSVPQGLFGQPGFQSFTVSASNPYNPFGTTVGISEALTSLQRQGNLGDTTFLRPLIGVRGTFRDNWSWEISAFESADQSTDVYPGGNSDDAAIQSALNSPNPAVALNPFVAGPPAPQAELQSFFSNAYQTLHGRMQSVNAFARGPLFRVPAGSVDVVLGSEYDHMLLSEDDVNLLCCYPPNNRTNFQRHSWAVFGEARVPILGRQDNNARVSDELALTLAGRHDSYSDFGRKNTPQLGLEWRPLQSVLIRATYAEAFKAPPLYFLDFPQLARPGSITDPLNGQTYQVTLVQGGNPQLRPESGQSRTLGVAYSSLETPGIQGSITYWQVSESNNIQFLSTGEILSHPDLFPGDVIRAPSQKGSPGLITTVRDIYANFGRLNVGGIDYQVKYQYSTAFGEWTPSLNASQIVHYLGGLIPGAPATDRLSVANDDGNWAPRWKGTVLLGWKYGAYSANLDGRYVSRYQDYDSTREIGNFWLADANFRVGLGEAVASNNPLLKRAYVEAGAVNVFNRLPQFSNYVGGILGYDPSESDIRGRFIYVQLGLSL